MTELLALPPTRQAIASMAALPRSQVTPTMLGTMRGPDGHLGPEAAGAVLMLQATFTTQEGSEGFWGAQAQLMELLSTAPGFMRSYGFGDGPNNTLLVFWRAQTTPRPSPPRANTAKRCATYTSSAGSTATSRGSGRRLRATTA